MRAITISPGPVKTGAWTDPDGFIARLVAFAASPNNITGAEYAIDGGVIKHV